MSVIENQSTGRRRDYGSFNISTLTPHIGAEVEGLDLSQP